MFGARTDTDFGPVITYANKSAGEINLLFYTAEKVSFSLKVSNAMTNYTLSDNNPRTYHRYKIYTDSYPGFYYHLISSSQKYKNKQAWVQIPSQVGYSFAVIGQSADNQGLYWNMVHLFEKIKYHQPAFLLHTGNIIPDSLSLDKWSQYFNRSESLLSRLAFIPSIGNADFYSVIWRRLFDVSNKRQPFYSYNLPLAHVLVVNSSMYFARDSSQYRWLEEELKKITDNKWKILLIHHAPFEAISSSSGMQNADVLGDMVLLLKKYKVDVIFSGSHHYYERSEFEGMTVVNSGGVGPVLFQAETSNPYRKVMIADKPHFVIGHITPKQLTVTAYDANNKRLDVVKLTK